MKHFQIKNRTHVKISLLKDTEFNRGKLIIVSKLKSDNFYKEN